MIKRKIISTLTIIFITWISKVNALSAWTLKWKLWWQLPVDWTFVKWWHSVFDMIRFVNSYLRFAIGFVCFLFMIINGYKLITANGNEKQTKAATSSLLWSVVWIVICLLAYIIVNVAVKLFA